MIFNKDNDRLSECTPQSRCQPQHSRFHSLLMWDTFQTQLAFFRVNQVLVLDNLLWSHISHLTSMSNQWHHQQAIQVHIGQSQHMKTLCQPNIHQYNKILSVLVYCCFFWMVDLIYLLDMLLKACSDKYLCMYEIKWIWCFYKRHLMTFTTYFVICSPFGMVLMVCVVWFSCALIYLGVPAVTGWRH